MPQEMWYRMLEIDAETWAWVDVCLGALVVKVCPFPPRDTRITQTSVRASACLTAGQKPKQNIIYIQHSEYNTNVHSRASKPAVGYRMTRDNMTRHWMSNSDTHLPDFILFPTFRFITHVLTQCLVVVTPQEPESVWSLKEGNTARINSAKKKKPYMCCFYQPKSLIPGKTCFGPLTNLPCVFEIQWRCCHFKDLHPKLDSGHNRTWTAGCDCTVIVL